MSMKDENGLYLDVSVTKINVIISCYMTEITCFSKYDKR